MLQALARVNPSHERMLFLPAIVSHHCLPYIPDIFYVTGNPAWSHQYIELQDYQQRNMQ